MEGAKNSNSGGQEGMKSCRKKGVGTEGLVLERGAGRKQGWICILVSSWRKGNFNEFRSIVLFLGREHNHVCSLRE